MNMKYVFVLAAVVAMFAGVANAATISVVPNTNPSFESDIVTDGGSTTLHSGWLHSNGAASDELTINPTNSQFAGTSGSPGTMPVPADGTQCLQLFSAGVRNLSTGLTIVSGNTYVWDLAMGWASDQASQPWATMAFIWFDPMTYDGAQFEETGNLTNATQGTFNHQQISFDSNDYPDLADKGYVLGVFVYGDSGACFDQYVVPEPSTFALLAAGLLGMVAYAWRKRK